MTVTLPAAVASRNGGFGELLRAWRTSRGQTQLALSLHTGVSARHLSYLETGRASPSRDMVLALAQALELPLRDRNALLQAAGFAAIYRETPLEASALGPVRDAIQILLAATEPYPTFVVNRRYDVLDANPTGRWILATFTEDLARFRRSRSDLALAVGPALAVGLPGSARSAAHRIVGAADESDLRRPAGISSDVARTADPLPNALPQSTGSSGTWRHRAGSIRAQVRVRVAVRRR